jgi:hypothetical protein
MALPAVVRAVADKAAEDIAGFCFEGDGGEDGLGETVK